MGKKLRYTELETGRKIVVDEDNCYITTYADMVKSGIFGRQKQYKYFCEHPEEIIDEKFFSELEEEFGNDETEEEET